MVYIPGGTFTMGATDGRPDELPLTRVTLSPYWIDLTEVTVADYQACVAKGDCNATGLDCNTARANWSKKGRETHPVNCVDWNQARAYCTAQGKRLPTEAEWEFAARGPESDAYPWGNSDPDTNQANWNSNGTVPVGTYPAGQSVFGVLDLAGNVSEWVEDAYAPYRGGHVRDPRQPSGTMRVVRGGSFGDYWVKSTRSATRGPFPAETRDGHVGFRCAG
jgi:formylglycine-generating enzyme required for sulfatase activity